MMLVDDRIGLALLQAAGLAPSLRLNPGRSKLMGGISRSGKSRAASIVSLGESSIRTLADPAATLPPQPMASLTHVAGLPLIKTLPAPVGWIVGICM